MTKLITLTLTALAMFSFTSTVSTHAQTSNYFSDYKVVNVKSGLNLRDRNCKKINVLSYGQWLETDTSKRITCTINGQSVKMVAAYPTYSEYTSAYVAESYTGDLIYGALDLTKAKNVQVNSPSGLNLRDQNCKKVMTFNDGKVVSLAPGFIAGTLKTCKVGNNFYSMVDVEYNGKTYLLADKYLKAA